MNSSVVNIKIETSISAKDMIYFLKQIINTNMNYNVSFSLAAKIVPD